MCEHFNFAFLNFTQNVGISALNIVLKHFFRQEEIFYRQQFRGEVAAGNCHFPARTEYAEYLFFYCNCNLIKVKGRVYLFIMGNTSQSYGASPAIWYHRLPDTS